MAAHLMAMILAVEVAVELVNSIGAATINQAAWMGLNALPTRLAREFKEQRKLQQDYLKCRGELNATSSQDEFAKWAKLRRQHDKLLDQLEKKKSALDATRSKFDRYITAVRWLVTRGLQYFLPFWYGTVPMFWLPYGWFPYYAEWLISFPRAPLGSVSITSWQLACTGFMLLLRDTLTALFGLARARQQRNQQMRGQRVAAEPGVPASGKEEPTQPVGTTGTSTESKKDI